jgi:hypothetical protein
VVNPTRALKTQKGVTKRIYAALTLVVVGGFTLFQAVRAEPTPMQARTRPSPQDVNVINPTSNPVPVRDVDNAARQPFHSHIQCSLNGTNGCDGTMTAPSGKELVIEFVSIDLFADSAVIAYSSRLTVPEVGNQEFYFPLPQQIDDGSEVGFVGVDQTRLYVAPSGVVQLHCALSRSVSLGACVATIADYLADVP